MLCLIIIDSGEAKISVQEGARLKDSIKKINTLIDYSNKINKQL